MDPVKKTKHVLSHTIIDIDNEMDASDEVLGSLPAKPMLKRSAPFKSPMMTAFKPLKKILKPLHSIDKADAYILSSGDENNMDIVLDPHISRKMRLHQKEGVKFLYNCVMSEQYQGAVLGDGMGLGKTLQSIGLIWTLLKQSRRPGQELKRVLVVCPASLVMNWKKEFSKWLGDARIKVYPVQQNTNDIKDFVLGRVYQVLVVGYEKIRSFQQDIRDARFELMICDEGHRLKNSSIQSFKFLQSLDIKKRVLLSGTPIQNDLQELYAIADFVNPGILGDPSHFKKTFENVIVNGRDRQSSTKLSQDRTKQLKALTDTFILRRTSDLNKGFLPPKSEYVLFCKLSDSQVNSYQTILQESDLSNPLLSIGNLRKVCNRTNEPTSKLTVLGSLLTQIQTSSEKVVIAASWTQTLDTIQTYLSSHSMTFSRLDGSTPSLKRQQIVDQFNDNKSIFVLLLSTRAGGVGLNLVGASRLVLFDIEWNPAHDEQAMARVWRDGQTKPVCIYRLLSTGTIEERMFQRQVSKLQLSETVLDESNALNQFNSHELKELFEFDGNTDCLTHDLLKCGCDGVENIDISESKQVWSHVFDPFDHSALRDQVLLDILKDSAISAVFAKHE